MRGLKIHFLFTDVLFSTEQIKQNNLCSCTLNDKFRALWDGARFTRPVLCWFAKEAQSWFALQRHLSSTEEQLGPFLRTPSTGITCLESLTTNSLFFPNYRVFCSCDDHRMIIVLVGQLIIPGLWWLTTAVMWATHHTPSPMTAWRSMEIMLKQCFSYGRLQVARKIILNTNHKMQLTI